MFDFPSSPSEGQIYNAPGGPSYIYNAPTWKVNNASAVADARRNRIVNGAMQISQENGNTAGTTAAYYIADQFYHHFASTGTFTAQRVQSVTPNGSKDRIRLTVTVADAALAAGDYLMIQQPIEGVRIADFRWGSASARQVILRFGWKSSAGTYSIRLLSGTTTLYTYIANFTISAGQANTDTEQTFVIPGGVAGGWPTDTSGGMLLTWVLATGTTNQGAAGWQAGNFLGTASNTNGMATGSAVFELFDVGLYLDAANTGVPPRWETPDEAQELAACMRYFQRHLAVIASGISNAAAQTMYTDTMISPMRIDPALAFANNANSNASTAANSLSKTTHMRLSVTASAAGAFYSQNDVSLNARF